MSDAATPNVAAYHRHLSNHLSNLLRATGSQLPAKVPNNQKLGTSATTSSTSLSKVSSLSTSENDPSTTSSPDQSSAVTPPQEPLPQPSKTPEAKPRTKSEREVEHDMAWKEAGAIIYSRLPSSFNLTLDKPHRNNAHSTSCPPPRGGKSAIREATMEKGMKGLGIDLAISDSQDVAIKMGLMVEPLVPRAVSPERMTRKSKPIEIRRLAPKPSHESLSARSNNTGLSPNFASSNSCFGQQIQAPRRRSQESGSGSKLTSSMRAAHVQSSLRDAIETEDDKVEEYELRREMRLKKKIADLSAKICRWRDAIPPVQIIEFPEIEPTPPTPSLASGMLRFSPFAPRPTSLPNGPSPPDIGIRFRALDALLGDMSLVQSSANLTLPLKPILGPHAGSLRSLSPLDPIPGFDTILGSVLSNMSDRSLKISEGMPTPKAVQHATVPFL